jgi:uncharacterized protein (DUF1501 family)
VESPRDDHASQLFGGALANGGNIVADWPGLKASHLYEGRDLKPTMRFEQFASDALARHYALDPARTRASLFPDFA